jgi:hypothetical protein
VSHAGAPPVHAQCRGQRSSRSCASPRPALLVSARGAERPPYTVLQALVLVSAAVAALHLQQVEAEEEEDEGGVGLHNAGQRTRGGGRLGCPKKPRRAGVGGAGD